MEKKGIDRVKSDNWLVMDFGKFELHYSNNKDRWEKAFNWLKNADIESLQPGIYPLEDDNLFATITDYPAKNKNETRFESHKKYIDIQHVVKGKELIGVAPLSKAKATTVFDDQKDIGFFEVPEEECSYYETGNDKFFVFFPDDAHRPGISIKEGEEVRKIVVKVRV